MDEANNTVIALKTETENTLSILDVAPQDMVFFTNGSMSQNSCFGDNTTVAKTNRDTKDRGVFTVWEKLAKRDEKFGKPEVFTSDIDKTKTSEIM